MPNDVICLRPEADFLKVGVTPPTNLSIAYLSPDDENLAGKMAGARALLIPAVGPGLKADLFAGSCIELVQVTGAGIDRVDADAMQTMNIAVANVPGGSSTAIAEYAVSGALTLLRRMLWANTELRKGNYAAARSEMVAASLSGLEGLTVGVIGLGVIGMTVAQAFHGMGGQIIFHDPAPRDPALVSQMDARPVSIDDLLSSADIVTLHVPLIPATRSMIGDKELGKMKAGAILINAARGGIVDEAALAAHLASGHLGGALVDVYSEEPPPIDNPLFLLGEEPGRRVLLTPHIAGVTRQSWAFLFRSAWQNVERVIVQGEQPTNRVV